MLSVTVIPGRFFLFCTPMYTLKALGVFLEALNSSSAMPSSGADLLLQQKQYYRETTGQAAGWLR